MPKGELINTGTKLIELKAEEAGVSPKEFVDKVAGEVKAIADMMNTSYDKFIRTTDDYHEKQVQKIFKRLYEQGDIYKGHYEGMYCTPCESFFTESQLVDGKCPDCGREVQPAQEEAYFFKMSKYADRLIEHINTHPEFIQPVSRKNEMMNNFLLPGLQDLCVSRTSFKWGIPVDFDPKHVVYVWLDALTNYITGIGYDCDGESTEQFKKDWPADLHLIGKDIIRFHTINSGGGSKNRTIEIAIDGSLVDDGHYVSSVVQENYGFAGRRFVEYLQGQETETIIARYREIFDEFQNPPGTALRGFPL